MIGEIKIDGIIGKDVGLVDVITQVKRQKGATSYRVHLSTKGGNVKEGYNIYNYLVSLGLPIEMIGENTVASIGTVIFMAGTQRRVEQNTTFFIHLPSVPVIEGATAEDLENYSKEMRKIEQQVIQFYVDKTGLTIEAIKPMLENQTFLTNDQLYEMGFTTEKGSVPLQAVAFYTEPKRDNKSNPKKEDIMDPKKQKQAQTIIDMVANFFKGSKDDAEMKLVLTSDQKELNFPELGEDDVIKVGDAATIDDAPAEGEIVLADGSSLVFEGGKVTEIKPKEEEETEEVEALRRENEELKEQLAAKETASAEQKEELDSVTLELTNAKKVLKDIQGIQSQMMKDDKKDKKDNKDEESKISDAVANLVNL